MLGWLMTDELIRIWKESLVAWYRYNSAATVTIYYDPADIQTRHLRNAATTNRGPVDRRTDGRTCIECAGRDRYGCSFAKFSEQAVGKFVWTLGLCWVLLWTTPFCINMSKLVSSVEWLADWAYVNTACSYGDKKGPSARAGCLSLTALNGFLRRNSVSLVFTYVHQLYRFVSITTGQRL